jgi:hypothetical protein
VTSAAMMNEVIDLKRAGGNEPTPEAIIALRDTEARIAELKGTLADRLRQAEAIATSAATAAEAASKAATQVTAATAKPHKGQGVRP